MPDSNVDVADHPLLGCALLTTRFRAPLGELPACAPLEAALEPMATPPADVALGVDARETLRKDVRDLLRHGGYRPTGRGKPSSEYLVRAATEKGLPRINHAVDACNAVSLHSGLPISVVDLAQTRGRLRIDVVDEGSYVFNASGQEIRLDGLLCLFDDRGPIANAVKDCHATKTSPSTTDTLSVLWSPTAHAPHTAATARWYASLLEQAGATVTVH